MGYFFIVNSVYLGVFEQTFLKATLIKEMDRHLDERLIGRGIAPLFLYPGMIFC